MKAYHEMTKQPSENTEIWVYVTRGKGPLFVICFEETSQGKQLFHLHFHFPSQLGSTLKGKNLLLKEQILSLKSRPYFERTSSSREANRKSQKLFPFVKIVDKCDGVLILLKTQMLNKSFSVFFQYKEYLYIQKFQHKP